MAIVCSSPDAPAGVVVNPTPTAGACTFTATGLAAGTYNFTLVQTDDVTNEIVHSCPVAFACEEVISSGEGLTKAEVIECIQEFGITKETVQQCILDWLAENPNTGTGSVKSCDAQSIVVEQCGKKYVLADWDGDGIINVDISTEFYDYTGIVPDKAFAEKFPTLGPDGNPSGVLPTTKYAFNEDLRCITHESICGEWVPFGSTKDSLDEPGFLFKCLDPVTYPLTLDTTTAGLTIGGVFYPFNITCQPKSINQCANRWEKYEWGNDPGTPLPDIRPGIAAVLGAQDGEICEDIFSGGHAPNIPNVVYAFSYPMWSNRGGTCFTQDVQQVSTCFDMNTNIGDVGVGMKVNSSLVWTNIVSVDAPPGAVLGVHYEIYGDHVRIRSAAQPLLPGPQRWQINAVTQAATPPNSAIDSLFWSMSGPNAGARDEIARMRMIVTADVAEPCYVVNNAADLAALANSVEPNSEVDWVVRDGLVCAHLPFALEPQYSAPSLSLSL